MTDTSTTRHTFDMSEAHAVLIHGLVKSQMAALQNWICSAVNSNNIERARELVGQYNEAKELYAPFNVEAKRDIADLTGKVIGTTHRV